MSLLQTRILNAKALLAMAASVVLSACATTVGQLPVLETGPLRPYVLGVGDTLQITVFDQPDLTGSYRVVDDGAIVMPLVGSIPAQGLEVETFKAQLTEQVQSRVVKLPNVTVSVSAYRPFYILGEVKNPGSYPYVPDMSVLTAVAIAGGFTYRAAQEEISVTRQTNAVAREWRAARDSRVLPGDVVYIFERHL